MLRRRRALRTLRTWLTAWLACAALVTAGLLGPGTLVAHAVNAPTVLEIDRAAGPLGGGTVVTIYGSGLTGASKVTFGSALGRSLTVLSDSRVRVTAPARASAGSVAVQVTTAAGTSPVSSASTFTYTNAPVVYGVSPATARPTAGVTVTVAGANLGGATTVSFGGVAGTGLTQVSATAVKVTAPARVVTVGATWVFVRVTTAAGTSPAVAASRFSYTFIAEVRAEILRLVNLQRAGAGLIPLTRSAGIDLVAQAWSARMATTGEFYHNPNYSSEIPAGWSWAGENIVMGSQSGRTATQVAAWFVDLWMASAGHRANILNANYTHSGVGAAYSPRCDCWWSTQDFARY